MRARRRLIGFAAAFAGLAAATVYAQRIWVGGPAAATGAARPPAFATRADFDGSFNYCRGFYSSVTREAGGSGWGTDYPGADNNFSVRLAELTRVRVKLESRRASRHTSSSAHRSAALPLSAAVHGGRRHRCGSATTRSRRCASYLLKGGFLWVDDFWGSLRVGAAGSSRSAACCRRSEYPIVDIPLDHPIMHTLYDVKRSRRCRRSASGTGAAADIRARRRQRRTSTSAASRTRRAG